MQNSAERTDQKGMGPVAADTRVIDLAVIVPHAVSLISAAGTACSNRQPSECFRLHTGNITAGSSSRGSICDSLITAAVRIVVGCSTTLPSTTRLTVSLKMGAAISAVTGALASAIIGSGK